MERDSDFDLNFANTLTVRRCTTNLHDNTLLRGTTPLVLLENFGQRLRSTAGGVGIRSNGEDDYDKSFLVKRLDIFFSHSWHASWWMKYLTLLFHFNAYPAVAAVLFTAALNSLQVWLRGEAKQLSGRERPVCSFWACTAVFLATLLTWHRVMAALNMTRKSIFLDKVCIHQTDPIRKAIGIKSIGGILRESKLLLVAWDPTYFTRLWCTFELAAYKFAQPTGKVIFLPVVLGRTTGILTLTTWGVEGVRAMLGQDDTPLRDVIYFVASVFMIVQTIWFLDDVKMIKRELRTFSVRKTRCFCCSNNHLHPETNETLPCDREEVNGSIAHWYGNGDVNVGLERFDQMIQGQLKDEVSEVLRGSRMPYKFVLLATVWPGMYQLDQTFRDEVDQGIQILQRCVLCIQTVFLAFPVNVGLVISLLGVLRSKWLSKHMYISVVLVAACNIMVRRVLIWINKQLKAAFTFNTAGFDPAPWAGLSFMAFEGLLVYCLYRSEERFSVRRAARRRAETVELGEIQESPS